jgi:hypothetical protein
MSSTSNRSRGTIAAAPPVQSHISYLPAIPTEKYFKKYIYSEERKPLDLYCIVQVNSGTQITAPFNRSVQNARRFLLRALHGAGAFTGLESLS